LRRLRWFRTLTIFAFALPLAGCPESKPPLVGGDRDAHGCIGSAGYEWCARERQCVRRWELAQKLGNDGASFDFAAYCSGK
jgi:hypothetical protein